MERPIFSSLTQRDLKVQYIKIMSVQGMVVVTNESEPNLVQFEHRDSS
jgi:hypothetical protein